MKLKYSVLLLLVMLLIVPTTFAMGMGPSKIVADFKADETQTYSFTIFNTERRDIDFVVYARGDLEKFVTVQTNRVHMASTDGGATITYSVNIPENAPKPGANTIEIVVEETGDAAESGITGKIALVHQLVLNVMQKGTALSTKISTNNPKDNEMLEFAFAFENQGTERISSLSSDVEIFDSDGVSTGTDHYVFDTLLSGQKIKFQRLFNKLLPAGNYRAEVTLAYAGRTEVHEVPFVVGTVTVNILGLRVDNFKLGMLNKVDVLLENGWSDALNRVVANLSIFDAGGSFVSDFQTAPLSLEAHQQSFASAYWDTAGVSAGTYKLHTTVFYDGRQGENDYFLAVTKDSLALDKGISGNVVASASGKGDSSSVMFLALAVIGLVIVNILLLLYFKRNNGPPPQQYSPPSPPVNSV